MHIFKEVICGDKLFSVVLDREKANGILLTDNTEEAEYFCKEYGMQLVEEGQFVVATADNIDLLFILCNALIRRLTVMSEISYSEEEHQKDMDRVKALMYKNPVNEIIVRGYRFTNGAVPNPFKAPRRLPMFRNNGVVGI